MENFNINDMKNLFGQTPINELPGVQGYSSYKLNWKLALGGLVVGSVLTLIIVVAVTKKGKKITYASSGTSSKSKSFPKTEDSISNQFSDYSSEIEESNGIENKFDKFDSKIEGVDEFDSTQ